MRPWAVGLSLFATLLSTVSYLAVPAEMIHRGPMILFGMAAYPLIILIVGWILIPRIMQFRVTTAYELLERRLGLGARMTGAAIFVVMRLLWMAVIVYATSDKVVVPLAGLDASATPWVCGVLGAVTLIYTSLGGLRAVVWTDVLQTFILFLGAGACLVVITTTLGGPAAWWPTAWAPHWETFQFFPDGSPRLSVFDMFLSTLIWYVATAGSDQMAIQRYLATRDVPAARRAFIINQCMDVVVLLFCASLGFALLGYYRAFPALLPPGQTVEAGAELLFPQFIVQGLPAGLTGLVVAGLLAAAMSSLSSGMSSISSVVTVDFIGRFERTKRTDAQSLRLAMTISFAVGILTVLLSFVYVRHVFGNLLEVGFKVSSLLATPLFLLFVMAMFVPWATGSGTIVGAIACAAAATLVAYWHELTGRPGLGFTWIMPVSLLVGLAVASAASLFSSDRATPLEAIAPKAPNVTPATLDAVAALIGPEIFANPVYNVRPKVPKVAAGAVPWHQDKSYWPDANSNPVITVWIPLVDSTHENGCLHIIPGTHRKPVLSYHADTYTGTGYTELDDEHTRSAAGRREILPLPVPAGTAILFNDRLMHMSTPNQSDHVRWSVDLRYQPTDQDPMTQHGNGFLARSHAHPERIATLDDWLAGRTECRAPALT